MMTDNRKQFPSYAKDVTDPAELLGLAIMLLVALSDVNNTAAYDQAIALIREAKETLYG